jgi:hypothetical protein
MRSGDIWRWHPVIPQSSVLCSIPLLEEQDIYEESEKKDDPYRVERKFQTDAPRSGELQHAVKKLIKSPLRGLVYTTQMDYQ